MATKPDFRQSVGTFARRLDTISQRSVDRRDVIDTTGNRSRDPGFRHAQARLLAYAERRYTSVARVCALLAILRDTEHLAARSPPVSVTSTEVHWQAYTGTETDNACHTCPCMLLFDGQPPTQLTGHRVLQRHLVLEFADCMLMPTSVNGIDKAVDEKLGGEAFVAAATHMLQTADATWRDGLAEFDRMMADIYANVRKILFEPPSQPQPRKADEEALIEMMCAYYEGMAAARENAVAVENYRTEVLREMAAG